MPDFYFTVTFLVPGDMAETQKETLERLHKRLEFQPFDWTLESEEQDNEGQTVIYQTNKWQGHGT
jgi:hypothetical protein